MKSDLENLIEYVPATSISIILHDSFNPTCRKGMKSVKYETNRFIHYVELDFISGVFEPNKRKKREMWGGFAHIVLLNEPRKGNLLINQSQQKLFDLAYLHSKYILTDKLYILKPLIKLLRR